MAVFFPRPLLWTTIALACMILATIASVAHLSVPLRFITMIRNNRSHLVWEIRLAGAFTTFLGLEFLSSFGWFQAFRPLFPWINFVLALLFLISTGWAYRFETHPAWKTSILPFYYLASASMVGLSLHSVGASSHFLPLFYTILLLAEGFLLLLYRGHLKSTSLTSLKKILMGGEKWTFLAFVWTTLLLPALLTFALLVEGNDDRLNLVIAISASAGIFLERVLFFWVEKPVYFLSFSENPESDSKNPYWIRG